MSYVGYEARRVASRRAVASQLSDVALKNEAAAATTAVGSTATVADERKNEHN